MDILRIKQNLKESFTRADLNLLADYFEITNNDRDRLWLIAIKIFYSHTKQKAQLVSSFIEFNEYFEKLRYLGKGKYGTVILVKLIKPFNDLEVGRNFALKLFNSMELTGNKLENLERELAILKTLSYKDNCHPHISCYYDYFETDINDVEFIGILMEYIDGIDLRTYIDTGFVSIEQQLTFMFDLVETLKYIHDQEIVHRDIKPENIMIDIYTDTIKYIDFGFSCFEIPLHEYECKIDQRMTPIYLSPDRLDLIINEKIVTIEELYKIYKNADIWALGMVFYEMIYNSLPPEYDKITNTLESLINTILHLDSITFSVDTEIDSRLIKIVKGMLNINPAERSSLESVMTDLQQIAHSMQEE
jgi:serine/threonine protein kinase